MSAVGTAFSSLRHRDFALFWSAGAVSNSGSWMQSITVPYVIWSLTRSTTWLGFAAFVSFFPGVVMGPLAGAVADRFSRRTALLVMQTAMMVSAFAFWGLWVSGSATPANLIVTLFLSALASGMSITIWQSFVPSLVPHDDLVNAVRLNTVQFTAARAVGPALAGLVLGRFGPGAAFFANALSFLLVIAALTVVRPRPNPLPMAGESITQQFVAGVRYVRARRGISLAVLTVFAMALLPSSVVQLAPAFAEEQFGTTKSGYGFLVAAYGVGSIVGSLSMAVFADRVRRSRLAMTGLAASVCGVLLLSSSTLYAVGAGALVLMGAAYVCTLVSLSTSIHVQVEEGYRGRVMSIYLMGLLAGLPTGALVLGGVSDVIGLRWTMAVTASALAAYAVTMLRRHDSLGALDALPELVDVGVGADDRPVEGGGEPDLGEAS